MDYLLFTAYLILFTWLVTKTPFFRKSGLNDSQLIIVFLIRIIAGIFYGWIGVFYGELAKMEDTWSLHAYGIAEYRLLFDKPQEYLHNLFYNSYEGGYGGLFSSGNSYWNDLKSNFLIKILSVFNLLSFGNYYINVIFYSFITLTGPVAAYRVMNHAYPGKKWFVLIASFLVPSFLFWTSGIHKEGLIFTAVAVIVFHLYFGMQDKKSWYKRLLPVLISMTLLLVFRNFLLMLIIPAAIAWLCTRWFPLKPVRVFLLIYAVSIAAFFSLPYISPGLNLPQAVVNKQEEFLQLAPGGSTIPVRKLNPDALSFAQSAPPAFLNTMARPFPGDVRHILSLAACSEIYVLLFIGLLALLFRTGPLRVTSLQLFCLFFSFTVLLSIGYTVNNLGAIVRYRSIIIPLLLVPAAASVNWARIGKYISHITNNNNT